MPRDLNNDADFNKCCCLARIAHKYHFQSVGAWALDILTAVWRPHAIGVGTFGVISAPTPRLVEATNIALLCQHARLTEIVNLAWKQVIQGRKTPDIVLAINTAEQHDLSDIKGRAYYAMMISGRSVWEQDGLLARPQRLRLLSGFHDLTLQCSAFGKEDPPDFSHSTCMTSAYQAFGRYYSPSANYCKSGWLHLWKNLWFQSQALQSFTSLSPADVIGRMSFIAANLKTLHDATLFSTGYAMAPTCLSDASTAITAMLEKRIENMPNLFVDPT